ncbi:NAD(P)-dependent dehydrogenase (short-subunit alcohol dehydrogenase family) [Conexibacter arvalis]|uniref:NAD(P)-dependent dehydrogenase (Short-subunit alcohol dehydrogenase family) n=2 Tax=Conexibacter arvalis TaxID=912552 RepID=A0A840I7T1_9ACTN|nr:NAD(P)-dependent dehydrogenase (short-subunit alcohol dehydrogenase family) [Conexibacter arvalis]
MERSVVVTGAGAGIGRAIAERLAADGWQVVGLVRSAERAREVAASIAALVEGDASVRADHGRAAAAARELAPLRGWVNNAGITQRTPLHDLDEAVVREIVDLNGYGYVWGCEAAVRAFGEQGLPGAIVNVSSVHGRASFADHAAYDFTKGGIDALTRNVAVSYGPVGVRANAIAAGGVMTPHLRRYIDAAPDPAAAEAKLGEGPPLRRIARAEEIAAVAAFLLSKEASYLSGQSIAVDGGWTAACASSPVDPAYAARFPAAAGSDDDDGGAG